MYLCTPNLLYKAKFPEIKKFLQKLASLYHKEYFEDTYQCANVNFVDKRCNVVLTTFQHSVNVENIGFV